MKTRTIEYENSTSTGFWTSYDSEGVKHYFYADGRHTFKGFDGFEYPYRSLKNMITLHKSTKERHSKLDGGASVSSYRGYNPNCSLLAKNPENICSKCYVNNMQFPSLVKKLKENTYNLTQRYLTNEELMEAVGYLYKKGVKFFRYEAFGDVINVTQAVNYLAFARAIDEETFIPQAFWTKRPLIWMEACKKESKPDSLKAVFSVSRINGMDSPIPLIILEFFDTIFTVYDKNADVVINCDGLECQSCMKCYMKGGCVNERLK